MEVDLLDNLVPCFDLPKPSIVNETNVASAISKGKKNLIRNWAKSKPFYLDSYDIPDNIRINNQHVFEALLFELGDFQIIPVIGLNRHKDHLKAAKSYLSRVSSFDVALRINPDEFVEFTMVKDEIIDIVNIFKNSNFHIIIDCRVIFETNDINQISNEIVNFIELLKKTISIHRLILTGSSIHAKISDHLTTQESTVIQRLEWTIFQNVKKSIGQSLIYGDYGIVSPQYSDTNIEDYLIQNVATPKLFYTGQLTTSIYRGGAFKTHRNGRLQYYDLASMITLNQIFRGRYYSIGDNFIYEKSLQIGNPSSQGQWYRMLNNAHISYVCKDLL